ncbi:hypothetical protein DYQ93_19410 [Xanthomonas sp. LMG 8992]|nr:hypothetical protein [Xanthomonas sp. LMG 8992]
MSCRRPMSLTAIACLLIASCVLSLLLSALDDSDVAAAAAMRQDPVPLSIQDALGCHGAVVQLACAAGIFGGFGWARARYVVWGLVGTAVGVAASPMTLALIPGMALFAVVVFLLFRPAANAFFASRGAANHTSAI